MFTNIYFNNQPIDYNLAHRMLWDTFHKEYGEDLWHPLNGHSVDEAFNAYEETCEEERRLQDATGETAKTLEWLADPANWNDPNWSDIFKDVHGYRPRF